MIGECLIKTLESGLRQLSNSRFTSEMKSSWLKLYNFVQDQVRIGLKQAEDESIFYANS